MVHATKLELKLPPRFSFQLVVESHGWFALAPFQWDREKAVLRSAFVAGRQPVAVEVTARRAHLDVAVASPRRPAPSLMDEIARRVRQVLSLDEDLSELHEQVKRAPEFAWIAEHGAGRMLRSPSVFEDMVKVLCTTNCSWSLTELMVRRLIDELGEEAPGGVRAFPTPAAMAARDERFYRERVRLGYRARAAVELAQAVDSARLTPERWRDPSYPRDAIEQELTRLRGFGPYAIGGLMRLLGHHEHLALDSWCRAQFARRYHAGRPVKDATIARRYAAFGSHRGLALWLDLTRDWHVDVTAPGSTTSKRARHSSPQQKRP